MIEQEANEILDGLEAEYRRTPDGVEVEFRKLCSGWAWAKRSDVYTHLIHRYPAKMLAYVPILFLSTRRYAGPGDPILDVFAGTGTVLLESIVHPVFPRSAYGVEINPLARLIAKVKTTPIDADAGRAAAETVVAQARYISSPKIPPFEDLTYWFPAHVIEALGRLVAAIDIADVDEDIRDFLLVCLSATVRRCSYADPHIPVPVRLRPNLSKQGSSRQQFVDERLQVIETVKPYDVFLEVTCKNLERVLEFANVPAVHNRRVEAAIICDDARHVQYVPLRSRGLLDRGQAEPLPDQCLSSVITSPPYGSAQKYTRATKLELLWLGLANMEEVATLDKASIGTERVPFSEYKDPMPTGQAQIDCTIEQIYERNRERAGLVSSYFRSMDKVVSEVARILRPSGSFILVVGNNTAAGLPVPNHRFIELLAHGKGFHTELLVRDPVRSRGMITKRHRTAGMVSDDWVLVLRKAA